MFCHQDFFSTACGWTKTAIQIDITDEAQRNYKLPLRTSHNIFFGRETLTSVFAFLLSIPLPFSVSLGHSVVLGSQDSYFFLFSVDNLLPFSF